jgi:hypothetical protein
MFVFAEDSSIKTREPISQAALHSAQSPRAFLISSRSCSEQEALARRLMLAGKQDDALALYAAILEQSRVRKIQNQWKYWGTFISLKVTRSQKRALACFATAVYTLPSKAV